LWELHVVIDLGEADHITAAATAVAVEQVLLGIDQKAWLVIVVQRTEPHPSTAAESPGRPPIVCFQVVQQGNLLFEFIECLPIHGLFASNGRIWRIAIQSQARMVGEVARLQPVARQSVVARRVARHSSRPAHRLTVDGSGDRDASAMSGMDRSQVPSAWCSRSHACCRQWRL
jgi:hypothetical protein